MANTSCEASVFWKFWVSWLKEFSLRVSSLIVPLFCQTIPWTSVYLGLLGQRKGHYIQNRAATVSCPLYWTNKLLLTWVSNIYRAVLIKFHVQQEAILLGHFGWFWSSSSVLGWRTVSHLWTMDIYFQRTILENSVANRLQISLPFFFHSGNLFIKTEKLCSLDYNFISLSYKHFDNVSHATFPLNPYFPSLPVTPSNHSSNYVNVTFK